MWSLEQGSLWSTAGGQLSVVALGGACLLALAVGSARPARVASVILLGRLVGGLVAEAGLGSPTAALILDAVLLAALLPLATRGRRLWPLFVAAYQLLLVATRGGGLLLEPAWAPDLALHVWTACLGLSLAAGALQERRAGRVPRNGGSFALRR